MSARHELLRLIRHAKDDLDDVARRLVLADWLEEHGDEADRTRGRVIRELALGNAIPAAVDALAREHREAWFGDIGRGGYAGLGPHGFTAWQASWGLLRWRKGPVGGETLAWLTELTLVQLSGTGLGDLVAEARLVDPVGLAFQGGEIGTEGVTHLSRLPADASLRDLNLAGQGIKPAAVRRLTRAAFAPRLHSLDLGRNRIGPKSLAELADSPLVSLRRLGLSDSRLPDADTAGLLRKGPLAGLRDLDMSHNHLGPRFCATLAASGPMPRLEGLDLAGNPLGYPGLVALAQWPGLSGLRRLRLGGSGLTRDGLRELATSPYLDRLERLELSGPHPFEADGPLRDRLGDRLIL